MQRTVNSFLKKLHIKKEEKETDARQRLKKELFAFNFCVDHGFPCKPSAMAYEPKLQLLAIGTMTGDIRVYGAPGVEFNGHHEHNVRVVQIAFLPAQGRLITVCSSDLVDSLHLWQIDMVEEGNCSVFREMKMLTLETSKVKRIKSHCLTGDGTQLLLGLESGDLCAIELPAFKISTEVYHANNIVRNAQQDFQTTHGAVRSIVQHPTRDNQVLIGYIRGLIVLWDRTEKYPVFTYHAEKPLESLTFYSDGSEFVSAHVDGSYSVWTVTDTEAPRENSGPLYGPFPCKAISKVAWKSDTMDDYIILSGGMPRASHGDRHTVTVMQGNSQHVVFDFMSSVIDFTTICSTQSSSSDTNNVCEDPSCLLVLTEEELVAIDLSSAGWPTHYLPYLNSIHSSPVLSTSHVSDVPDKFWNKIVELGRQKMDHFSNKEWPIKGGHNVSTKSFHDLLLTGHEDGSVCFWNVSTCSMRLLYKLSTASIFNLNTMPAETSDLKSNVEDEWPPFRKIGTYDPFSDEPQVGIQKIIVCCQSEVLLLAGTAGQVIVFEYNDHPRQKQIPVSTINMLTDGDSYIWKGHDAMVVRDDDIMFPVGFQPKSVLQVNPPSLCTALTVNTEWKLLAVGTAHGYGLYNYAHNRPIFSKSTLTSSDDEVNAGGFPNRRAIRKSLRESFRRLRAKRIPQMQRSLSNVSLRVSNHPIVRRLSNRMSRSSDPNKQTEPASEQPQSDQQVDGQETRPKEYDNGPRDAATPESPNTTSAACHSPQEAPSSPPPEPSTKHSSGRNEFATSTVHSLCLVDTFLLNAQEHTPSLWVGTDGGMTYLHVITLPAPERRLDEDIECDLIKAIHSKHGAPIISMCVVDRAMKPLSGGYNILQAGSKAPDMTGGHHVIVCSEKQIKIMSLPNFNVVHKFKLSSQDASKIQRLEIANFISKSDENFMEHDILFLTNTGEVQVLSLPHLRPQLKAEHVQFDQSSLNACTLTLNGEGFFLSTPSEFKRFSFSANRISKPRCSVNIKQGARPAVPLNKAAVKPLSPAIQTVASSDRPTYGSIERSVVTPTTNSKAVTGQAFTNVEHDSQPDDDMSNDEDDEIMAVNGNEESSNDDDEAANGNDASYHDEDIAANADKLSDCEHEIEAIGDDMSIGDDDDDTLATAAVSRDKKSDNAEQDGIKS